MKKYSLGIGAFISALVGITIDGDIQNSVTVTIWAGIRALRTLSPSIPHAPVRSRRFQWVALFSFPLLTCPPYFSNPRPTTLLGVPRSLFSDRDHVCIGRSNSVHLAKRSFGVAGYLQKLPRYTRRPHSSHPNSTRRKFRVLTRIFRLFLGRMILVVSCIPAKTASIF